MEHQELVAATAMEEAARRLDVKAEFGSRLSGIEQAELILDRFDGRLLPAETAVLALDEIINSMSFEVSERERATDLIARAEGLMGELLGFGADHELHMAESEFIAGQVRAGKSVPEALLAYQARRGT